MVGRKRSKIHGLRRPSREWYIDNQILHEEAIKYFKTLFCSRESISSKELRCDVGTLLLEARRALTNPITKQVFQAPWMNWFRPCLQDILGASWV